jgi:hypothetical protein
MAPRHQPRQASVSKSGAAAGSVLCGAAANNQGLRLRVLQDQRKGQDGPLTGQFVILDVGQNMHSASLAALLGKVTDAAEVLAAIRRNHRGCVSVANARVLCLEQERAGP